MKYLLLVHHNEEAFGKMSEAVRGDMLKESIGLCHELHARGQYVHASPLERTATARCVQVREGRRTVTDGPFVETHEQLAGYFLIEAGTVDEATAVAARVPGARIGTVEIRPVRAVVGLPAEAASPIQPPHAGA